MRRRLGLIGGLAVAALVTVYPLPAGAHDGGGTFTQENLVSDQAGVAQLQDDQLVNPWGMSRGANTPIWVSDNGADASTLYSGAVGNPESPVVKNPNIHPDIAGGAPTGQVFNDVSTTNPKAFLVPGTMTAARFMFAGEDGDISVWAGGDASTPAAHVDGGIFKGLALAHSAFGPLLLVADFGNNRIDVFDGNFQPIVDNRLFQDRHIPSGFAPFNVAEFGNQVYVTYAKKGGEDDIAGPGNGFVDVYTNFGAFVQRLVTRGVLNSPWGMVIAPDSFGKFAGDLLVGNFGDGRIHAFDPHSGRLQGTLLGTNHRPIVIDGLWGLITGDDAAGGLAAVWFSAGPDEESHGLLGILRAH